MSSTTIEEDKLTKKDFVTPNDVRWCPGCGDYSILNAVQRTMPDLGIPKEKFVVVSGIGCSSRFPYYMNTYGFHTIHGRAPTVATGVKVANPDLSVWMITGDGDGLSIGGNHLLHLLRRNLDINVLLFNNRIYGLTKGQYSPTSEVGKKTKSTPAGSVDYPVNPLLFALGSEATFIARTVDTDQKHMVETFKAAHEHKGTSFVEVFQNCVIFNNKTFETVTAREVRSDQMISLEKDKPLVFGQDMDKGIRLNGLDPEVVDLKNGITEDDLLVHDPNSPNPAYATLLAQMTYPTFPTPVGVLRQLEGRETYEDSVTGQIKASQADGEGSLQELLTGKSSWVVED
ncbi:MAG: 2-oxoacid:ferredoxin oxidoreductase subunit beta [Opitutae bacterium]|nr:2-oxoacid:ferredoxin oxidoreductase subunit beta [Opitutae bacterium]|tara:strand:+ start:3157 stop:4185 length:1029 start_codon:yes stop_codon:yes gene_type:complete